MLLNNDSIATISKMFGFVEREGFCPKPDS